jgi:adenosylcobinamide-GDP ribazoletransferase
MTTVSRRTAAGAGLSALGLAVLLLRVEGLLLWAGAGVLIWLLSRYFKKTLGGVTGDVLGAANEVVEVAVLVGALLFS